MPQTYTIVKKNSKAHKDALISRFFQNRDIIAVGDSHVFIPHIRRANFGHNVSHAKNRTNRLFRPNMRTMTLEVEGAKKTISLTNRDARTFKKVVAASVLE